MPEISVEYDSCRVHSSKSPEEKLSKLVDGETIRRLVWQGLNSSIEDRQEIDFDLEKVRFTGARPYGLGASNVPDVLISIKIFYRASLASKNLKISCEKISGFAADMFGLHVIVKATAGNLHGFGEARPE